MSAGVSGVMSGGAVRTRLFCWSLSPLPLGELQQMRKTGDFILIDIDRHLITRGWIGEDKTQILNDAVGDHVALDRFWRNFDFVHSVLAFFVGVTSPSPTIADGAGGVSSAPEAVDQADADLPDDDLNNVVLDDADLPGVVLGNADLVPDA